MTRSLREPFDPATGALAAEIIWAVRHEGADTLADILFRRTMVGLNDRVGLGADEAAAAIARRHLGWDEQRADHELASYRTWVQCFHPQASPSLIA